MRLSRTRASRGAANIGCVIWLAIVALLAYAGYKIIPVKIEEATFSDFLEEESSFGSIKSQQQIEAEILAKAREMKLPITKDNLTIKKTKELISVEVNYVLVIDFFNGAYKYVWQINRAYAKPLFNV
jgi:hypothetical protein